MANQMGSQNQHQHYLRRPDATAQLVADSWQQVLIREVKQRILFGAHGSTSSWRHGSWRLHAAASKDLTSHGDILQQRGITPPWDPMDLGSAQCPPALQRRINLRINFVHVLRIRVCAGWVLAHRHRVRLCTYVLQQASKRKACMIYASNVSDIHRHASYQDLPVHMHPRMGKEGCAC